MKTIIKSLTIISLPGVKTYEVGKKYNGLALSDIQNWSMEFPESLITIFKGFTEEKSLVFEVINAPVEIEYSLDEKDEVEG